MRLDEIEQRAAESTLWEQRARRAEAEVARMRFERDHACKNLDALLPQVERLREVREATAAYIDSWDHYEAGDPERVKARIRLNAALSATKPTE